jgi:hypothetical protein
MMNYVASLKVPWLTRVPKFKKPKIVDFESRIFRPD